MAGFSQSFFSVSSPAIILETVKMVSQKSGWIQNYDCDEVTMHWCMLTLVATLVGCCLVSSPEQ